MALGIFTSLGEEPPLQLSIIPSQMWPQGQKQTVTGHLAIYVLITNVSKAPVEIYEDWNRWGWLTLQFEITDSKGQSHRLKRLGGYDFTRNFPATFAIPSGGHCIREVRLQDEWEGWADLNLGKEAVFKVIYEQPKDEYAEKDGVWTGHAESKPATFSISP
jgi:hypothetical protein